MGTPDRGDRIMVNKSVEITEAISDEGISKLKVGQILMFKKDGKRVDMKITRILRKDNRIWAKVVATFDPMDIQVTSKGMFGKLKHKPLMEKVDE